MSDVEIYTRRMFDNFKMMFPWAAEQAVTCYGISQDEIVVRLNDGTAMVWNDLRQCGRSIQAAEDNEEVWRRRFGKRLRDLIMARGGNTNYQDFADAIGVSRVMLSRYMNGHATPGYFIIKKMAHMLGCPVSELTEFPDFE